ncbi:hypothetical protein UREG_04833 [Uncinocarpus reesii 1704]|uniref:Catalase core domain-containing protein n=1 Tax=Uncinocarpus reesii (strain UAMH 1704) TaxID=336963 RepID=C4JUN0_UNCRE|nr:uncharacterized protein UREG_04833 [Uncinocarpus reesii 1704]EEP79991.1 hypothetical protein UREG_04833 [Uncinocarpus reesii 1704]
MTHPVQAVSSAIGAAGFDPRAQQLTSLFQGANDGPAKVAARITGLQQGGKRADDAPYFTNNEGIPFPDAAHSKTAGGLPLVSDTFLLQKQQHFNRSKNLERMGHIAGGSGAFGYFETTKDMSSFCKAHFLRGSGVTTPVFVRFSTVTFGREFPDSGRNPRGFAIKFYTGEGPDVIRSQSRNPRNFLLDYNSLFDLLANTPEGVNGEGKFVYIKYHFLADHGQRQFTWDEAVRMSGEDPDYSKRDLWSAIENGEKISWTAHVQIMEPEEADAVKLGFDPFDVTKVWPRDRFPMHEFGKLILNKNPENFHRDVEQAAFSPGSMVPGIEDSPDPLLQFRMFFYRDAQYHRIGINLHQVPVNCPFMAQSYSSLNFDGPLRVDANHAMNPQYTPNSFVHKFRPDTAEARYQTADKTVGRGSHFYHEGTLSEYEQPRELYKRVMTAQARDHLHRNTAGALRLVDDVVIQTKYLAQLYLIDPEYARGVYELLPEKKFEFSTVEEKSVGAEKAGKEPKFLPGSDSERLLGVPISSSYG